MPKVIGIALIFFACIFFSYEKATALKQELMHLKQMRKALMLIKNEISFSAKELSQMVNSLKSVLSDDMDVFFGDVASFLASHETADFGQAWEAAKEEWEPKPFLSRSADRIMTAFSQQVGKMPREAELMHFEKTIEAIDGEIAEAEISYEKNRKLIYTLGICVSTAVFILFL